MAKAPASVRLATVVLDRNDEASSFHDKLEAAAGETVIVVIPRSVRSLRSPLYLKILRRTAEQLGKQIAIVAEDWLTRDLARQEGLPAFRSARSVNGSAFRGAHRLPDETAEDVARPLELWRRRFTGRWSWAVHAGAAVSLLVMIALVLLMLPSATVTLVPITQDLSENLTLVASTEIRSIELSTLQVPARRVESQAEGQEKGGATGKKTRGDQFAIAQETFTNNTTLAITLPKGFLVQTVDNRQFALQADLIVPAGARAAQTVPVRALEPGAAYNVAGFAISRLVDPQLANRLTVTNNDPAGGGTDVTVDVILPEDIAKARTKLSENLRRATHDRLFQSRVRDESIYDESITYTLGPESADRQAGEETKEFNLRMAMSASAVAFNGNDVNTVAVQRLSQAVEPGFHLDTGSLRTKPVGLSAFDDRSVTFFLSADAKATPDLDDEALKRSLANRGPEDAVAWMNRSLALSAPPEVQITPAWFRSISVFPWRINLIIRPRE